MGAHRKSAKHIKFWRQRMEALIFLSSLTLVLMVIAVAR
jgi:hypothetical protein